MLSGPDGEAGGWYDWTRSFANGTFSNEADDSHSTISFTREAQAVIRNHADVFPRIPLFLFVGYTAPHTPLLAEPEWMDKCLHLVHPTRQAYCGLVVGLDEGIANLTATIREELGDDVVFIFSTDNGGMPHVGGNNYPLRGGKNSAYNGGSQCVGFVTSKTRLGTGGREYTGMMHIVDWLPTLLGLVDRSHANDTRRSSSLEDLDGIDMWDAIQHGRRSPREVRINLSCLSFVFLFCPVLSFSLFCPCLSLCCLCLRVCFVLSCLGRIEVQ